MCPVCYVWGVGWVTEDAHVCMCTLHVQCLVDKIESQSRPFTSCLQMATVLVLIATSELHRFMRYSEELSPPLTPMRSVVASGHSHVDQGCIPRIANGRSVPETCDDDDDDGAEDEDEDDDGD